MIEVVGAQRVGSLVADGAQRGGGSELCAVFIEHDEIAHHAAAVDGEFARGRDKVGTMGPEHVAAAQLGTAAQDDGQIVHQSVGVGIDHHVSAEVLVDIGDDFLHQRTLAGCHHLGIVPTVGVDARLLLVVAARLTGRVRGNLCACRCREERSVPVKQPVGRMLEVVIHTLCPDGLVVEELLVEAEGMVYEHFFVGLVGKLHEADQIGLGLPGCQNRSRRQEHGGQQQQL